MAAAAAFGSWAHDLFQQGASGAGGEGEVSLH